MKDKAAHARGWFLKGDSEIVLALVSKEALP